MTVTQGAKPLTSNDILLQARALESAFDKGAINNLPHQTRIREANLAFIDAVEALPQMSIPELNTMLQQRVDVANTKSKVLGYTAWIGAGFAMLAAAAGVVDPSLKSTLPHLIALFGGTMGFLFSNVLSSNAQTTADTASILNRDVNEFVAGAGRPSLNGVPLSELVAQTVDVQAEPKD